MAARSKLDDMTSGAPAGAAEPDAEVTEAADPILGQAPASVYNTDTTFSPDEVITARISLAQGLSPEVRAGKAREGQILMLGHPPVDAVTLVIAGHTPKRRFVEEGQQRARCYSPDGKEGWGDPGTLTPEKAAALDADSKIKGADGAMHLACAACPFSQWVDTGKKDAQGRTVNKPPICNDIDSFLVYSLTHNMPALFDLKGTGAQTARFIKTLVNGLGMGRFALEVTAETKTAPGRQWQAPKAVLAMDGITVEECEAYSAIARTTVKTSAAIPAQAGA